MTSSGLFRVETETGPFSGGLYELEQVTIHRVVDAVSEQILLEFSGVMNASLDRDTGSWGAAVYSGVAWIKLSDDQHSVLVSYYDGREESISIMQ